MGSKTASTNRKAFRDYLILERWDCGIELKGGEVKSVRDGGLNFKDSFARIENNEVILYNLHINPYGAASHFNVETDRPRKLLLHKKEIKKIVGLTTQKHLALIPLKLYFNRRGFAKIELGVGRGKKLYDKRDAIKQRDVDREIGRTLRSKR